MKSGHTLAVALAFLIMTSLGASVGMAQEAQLDRTELPVKGPWYPPITTLDARDAKSPPVFEVKVPVDAPNVVVILLDDLGFGGTSAFGGAIDTPHFDKLASQGLMYNQFHTTALCSPTRQALKTGRNHHSANQAKITEVATSFPGATGMLPNDVASIAETLRLNGYSTAAYGKWHETAVWEISPSGPFTRWPNYQGFDEFYGFLGGETNQWYPDLVRDQQMIDQPYPPEEG
jgi:arylsulfatase